MRVTLHALHNRDISLRFSETTVMTRAHMLPYVPLCAFCPQNECHSSHSWAESLFSRDDLQLISPSEHVEEGQKRGWSGGISYTQTSLACRWAQETHRTGSVLFHCSVCVSVTAVLSVMCVCSCLSISLRASLSFSPLFFWVGVLWSEVILAGSHSQHFPILELILWFRTSFKCSFTTEMEMNSISIVFKRTFHSFKG